MRAVSKITLSQLSHLKASRPPAASAKTLAQPGLRAGTVPPAPADRGCRRDPWWSLAELLAARALKFACVGLSLRLVNSGGRFPRRRLLKRGAACR